MRISLLPEGYVVKLRDPLQTLDNKAVLTN